MHIALRHFIPTGSAFAIENRGPVISSTTYWDSPLAASGVLYCSFNAGVVRLLVPRARESALAEMHTGHDVLITRGPSEAMGQPEALELHWDDGSDAPLSMILSARQFDFLIDPNDAGRRLTCHAYTRGFRGTPQLVGTWPARFRVARSLPHLKPRGEN